VKNIQGRIEAPARMSVQERAKVTKKGVTRNLLERERNSSNMDRQKKEGRKKKSGGGAFIRTRKCILALGGKGAQAGSVGCLQPDRNGR